MGPGVHVQGEKFDFGFDWPGELGLRTWEDWFLVAIRDGNFRGRSSGTASRARADFRPECVEDGPDLGEGGRVDFTTGDHEPEYI